MNCYAFLCTKIVYTCTTENPYSPDSISVKKLGSRIYSPAYSTTQFQPRKRIIPGTVETRLAKFFYTAHHACTRKYSRIKFGTCTLLRNIRVNIGVFPILVRNCQTSLSRICRVIIELDGWIDTPQISIPRIRFQLDENMKTYHHFTISFFTISIFESFFF